MEDTQISDSDLEQLSSFRPLRIVVLSGSRITNSEIQRFQDSQRYCAVFHYHPPR